MDKGKGRISTSKQGRRIRQKGSSSKSNAMDFKGFPVPPRSPEPRFRLPCVDVTEMWVGKNITPNSPELFENEGSPPRARETCKFYCDGNSICPRGFDCPDLHGIFGIQEWCVPEEKVVPVPPVPPVEEVVPLAGSKRKAEEQLDSRSPASGSKRHP